MLVLTDQILILIFLALNIGQFIFWSYQNQKLVNKLMSRSYFEYNQVTTPEKPKGFKINLEEDEALSGPDQTRIMDELLNRNI